MAKKKNFKKYTPEQKYNYHSDRYFSCGKYGLKFGSPGHLYSDGFRDAFSGRDNSRAVADEFGKKSGEAYALGYKRGRKASFEYLQTTGKQPFTLT